LNQKLIESGRYRVFSRRNLARVIDEQDFRESGLALANKVRTKLPSVDAIITGSINAGHQYGTETKRQYDPVSKAWKSVSVQYLICEATLSFEMLAVNTGEVIATVGEVAKYDSREAGGGWQSWAAMAGVGPFGGRLPPPQSKLAELIDECVYRFIAKIAPHPVSFTVRLEKGESDLVKTGNKFAKSEQWADAEQFYRQAIEADAKNEDHGAHFNLGVALEAQGKVKEAAAEYKKAIGIKADKKYIENLGRLRRLTGV
jgi:tetratricopeptide (TPR) repeat protein